MDLEICGEERREKDGGRGRREEREGRRPRKKRRERDDGDGVGVGRREREKKRVGRREREKKKKNEISENFEKKSSGKTVLGSDRDISPRPKSNVAAASLFHNGMTVPLWNISPRPRLGFAAAKHSGRGDLHTWPRRNSSQIYIAPGTHFAAAMYAVRRGVIYLAAAKV